MAVRSIRKGVLKIGSNGLPVKLYAAIRERKVHFHVLQDRTKSRVKPRMVRDSGAEVAREEFRKGYEIKLAKGLAALKRGREKKIA
jgi:DNA end-binding protein Ku